jgi:para-nitrobenzyl esterase
MKKILWFSLAIILLVGLGLGGRWWFSDSRSPAQALDPASERLTAQGAVVGFAAGDAAQGWMGIPYAAPPLGALRWRAPQAPPNWQGTRQALAAGDVCPQLAGPLAGASPSQTGQVIGQEDCLTLNLWAPRHSQAEIAALAQPYPVMVWIHGGGNTVGYGADYDGRWLAADQQVIVVTFNYRLGVLGWFNHPAITGTATTPEDASGNFGTLDTIAVLQWVQDNIAAFGGDPQRVTVFGESAGGMNVFALLASPLAKGLFHRAISQSGIALGIAAHEARDFQRDGGQEASARELASRWLLEQGAAADRQAADQLQQDMNPQTLQAFLSGLAPADLIGGFDAPGGMYQAPALILDGQVLPEQGLVEALADPAVGSTVPLIAGSNRDEAKLFMALDDAYVERRWGVLVRVRDAALYDDVAGLLSDHWRLVGVDQPLDAIAAAGGPAYGYRFDWDETGSNAFADMPQLAGAAHGFELPFVFGDFSGLWGIPLLFSDENEAGRLELSAAMMAYWGGFTRSGTPAGEGLPAWTGWSKPPASGHVLVLDTPADGGIRMQRDQQSWGDLHARLQTLGPALGPELACGLYIYMFRGSPVWSDAGYNSLAGGCPPV